MYVRVGHTDLTVWTGDFNAHIGGHSNIHTIRGHTDSRGAHLWDSMSMWGYSLVE